jgi:hypothetical protein
MGALNFIFHNSAAGLYVTFINFSITLWQTGLVEEQVRVRQINNYIIPNIVLR